MKEFVNIKYYMVFCTRNRRKVFQHEKITSAIKGAVKISLEKMSIKLESIRFGEEYMYVEIKANEILSPKKIGYHIRKDTFLYLKDEFKEYNKIESLWYRDFYVSTDILSDENIGTFITTRKVRS